MDIVGRSSYRCDILFRVIDIRLVADGEQVAILYGEDIRLIADAPFDDLNKINMIEERQTRQKTSGKLSKSNFVSFI